MVGYMHITVLAQLIVEFIIWYNDFWFLISTFFVGDRHPFPFFDSRFIIYSSWKIFSSSFLIWNSLIMVYDRNCFLSQGRFDPLSTSSTSILSMLLDSCLFDDKELTTSCSSFIPMQNDSENKTRRANQSSRLSI